MRARKSRKAEKLTQWVDLTPIVAFSQWDLLAMGLIGMGIGMFSVWYRTRENKRVNDKPEPANDATEGSMK